jgi:DNA polymerase phi
LTESLFAQPSLSLKATGFNLLLVAIRRVPPTEVPDLFGAGVVRTLANHLRSTTGSEKTLSRIAQKVAASLPIFLKSNPTESFPVLRALVAPPHGLQTFDPKTVDKLVAMLDPKGVRGWARYLKQYALGSDSTGILDGEDERTVNTRRLWAFDQLLHIARFGAVEKDEETLIDLLEYFAVLGWFQIKVAGKGAVSPT